MSEISVRTCQAPSQFKLKPPPAPRVWPPKPKLPRPWPSLTSCPSYSCADGLVPNTNPFCRSRKVSITNWKLSLSVSDASRRLSVTMMDEGSRS